MGQIIGYGQAMPYPPYVPVVIEFVLVLILLQARCWNDHFMGGCRATMMGTLRVAEHNKTCQSIFIDATFTDTGYMGPEYLTVFCGINSIFTVSHTGYMHDGHYGLIEIEKYNSR